MILLGETARHLRESRQLTQRAAAHELGISVVHLCNIETGKAQPSAALLQRYYELWGVDLYVLAWCRHGDISKLPKAVRKPMIELARAWEKELGVVAKQARLEATSQCSNSGN